MWSDEQLERRINRKVTLVTELSRGDLLAIARKLHPDGDDQAWLLLAGYARACVKKNASAIEEALQSALHLVNKNGRQKIEFADIEEVLEKFHFPGDGIPSLRKTTATTQRPRPIGDTGMMRFTCEPKAQNTPFRRVSAAAPRTLRESRANPAM